MCTGFPSFWDGLSPGKRHLKRPSDTGENGDGVRAGSVSRTGTVATVGYTWDDAPVTEFPRDRAYLTTGVVPDEGTVCAGA